MFFIWFCEVHTHIK